MKCYVINGSVVNGLSHPVLYSFVLDKLPGYKRFSGPETIHYEKTNKSVLNTIILFLDDENYEGVNFNGETSTFTLQMIKIRTNMFTYNYMSIYICIYILLYLFV